MRNLTDSEIYEQIDKADENIQNGTGYHGMSYEEGVDYRHTVLL